MSGDMSAEAMQRALGCSVCCPVRHQGELLGIVGASGADDAKLGARDLAVIADIADHAGLVVHNAVLTVGLARHADRLAAVSQQLRHTRRRLVAAQDAERRRIERNLHDGAQQALVAALIAIRNIDPSDATPSAVQSAREIISVASESLNELTRADRPGVLDEAGLAGAIQRAADLLRPQGIDVALIADVDDRRLDPDVQLAVYFCCVEALQNIAKYANATLVGVELSISETELRFAVTDNGRGFDIDRLQASGGLRRLDERLAVVAGTLTVQTSERGGTRVAGQVPARALDPAS
jgi:signal transduction histidine kinase